MSKIQQGWVFCIVILIGFGVAAADNERQFESFLVFHPVHDGSAALESDSTETFSGLTDIEMIDVLTEISSKTTCEWNDRQHAYPGFSQGELFGVVPDPELKAQRRPVVPPPLIVASMAAQALNALDTGTCFRCFFGRNAITGRPGFDIRWKIPIEGIPNAYLYKGFEDIPMESGPVIEIPPDPELVVEAAKRLVEVAGNPQLVINSSYDSGGGVNFYYFVSYDVGDGPRAFFTWEIRVQELK